MKETKRLLIGASHEIRELRRQNEILRAKVETMDLFALVFRTAPNYGSVGMGEDIAWAIDREVANINEQEKIDAHEGHSGGRVDESRPSRNGG